MNRISSAAVPAVVRVTADGQFQDTDGNPVPYVVAGGFSSTTSSTVKAGKTASIQVADIGIQVGDYIVLGSDLPRPVTRVSGLTVTVASAFGVNASGTTAVTVASKHTPKLSWVSFAAPTYGPLPGTRAPNYLQGLIQVHSDSDYDAANLSVTLEVDGIVSATKVVKFTGANIVTRSNPCQADPGEDFAAIVAFATNGLRSGESCRMRASATAHYVENCYRKGGTFALGPKLGPASTIP